MSETIIKVENVSKRYLLTHLADKREQLFSRLLINKAKAAGSKVVGSLRGTPTGKRSAEEFWALKDISFDIKQGDRVGIIGRNGAGKSTLLKILSRITEPTKGRITIDGRVASLLEVGTGFHSELTGRENIFLNGAILGMSREEIVRKFDEIVAFAEVERFLDTPVKRYSSGMYVRLAFAVAAHLEPEILIVDEVLAVGDADFQKKCLGKMEDVSRKEGRTVLFVSHNMNAIEHLCSSVMMLKAGQLEGFSSNVREGIKSYLYGSEEGQYSEWDNKDNLFDKHGFQPLRLSIETEDGRKHSGAISNDSDFYFVIEGNVKDYDPTLMIGYGIYTEEGNLLYWSYHTDAARGEIGKLEKGHIRLRSKIPKRLLNEGAYIVELLSGYYFREWITQPLVNAPSITLTIQGGLSDSPYWMQRRDGILAPVIEWEVEQN